MLKNKSIKILERQKQLNKNLANYFREKGVNKLRLTSLGNSIASGYSMVRTIRPLLLRNESIQEIMKANGIDLERYNFARPQNNNDEHIFEWLETNIKESEIHRFNRTDYSNTLTSMTNYGLNDELKEKYYPLTDKSDKGLKDLLTESSDNMANIIVYNGATGSFLDALTRNGSLGQQLMYGVRRDLKSLEATLKVIQTNNRLKKSNTQVYLCGAPNYLGTRISELINHKLKKLTKEYSNVVYVEPVKAKMLYDKLKTDEYFELSKFKRHLKGVDFHYDELEYAKLNNNILETIYENYLTTKSLISIDRNLYDFNKNIEVENDSLFKNQNAKKEIINNMILNELNNLENLQDKIVFLKRLKKYILNRFPYDFFYIGKKEVKSTINETKSLVKNCNFK